MQRSVGQVEAIGVHRGGVAPIRGDHEGGAVVGPAVKPVRLLPAVGEATQARAVRAHDIDLLVQASAWGQGER